MVTFSITLYIYPSPTHNRNPNPVIQIGKLFLNKSRRTKKAIV